ncbi:MAG: PQQ-binding-like beta-propeller repeat protein [Kiritimatiellia bacterium]|nr:PQQ-binding-like beta-propeller repeat protein [Kiritimatiellia bacterium]
MTTFNYSLCRNTRAVLTLACTLLVAADVVWADEPNWPRWRGPTNDGKSTDTGLLKSWPEGGPKLLWHCDDVGQGFSSPTFANGCIYITGRNPATRGEELFTPAGESSMRDGRKSTTDTAKPRPRVGTGYYKYPGTHLHLTCLDMNGKILWTKDIGEAYEHKFVGSRSSVTTDDGLLYVFSGKGVLGCYDGKNGETKWTRSVDDFEGTQGIRNWGWSESPLIVDDRIIFTPGGEKTFMVALDKKTGKTVWQSPPVTEVHYVPARYVEYKDIPMIITGSKDLLIGIHAETGKLLWTHPHGEGSLANVPTPVFHDGHVFWAVGYGRGAICIRLEVDPKTAKITTKELWKEVPKGEKKIIMNCQTGGYVLHGGFVYGTNNYEGWTCLEMKTGKPMWQVKGVSKGSICWADGMLYMHSLKDGRIALVECTEKEYKQVGELLAPTVDGKNIVDYCKKRGLPPPEGPVAEIKEERRGPSWSHPVVTGGRLYQRFHRHLYCYDVKAK